MDIVLKDTRFNTIILKKFTLRPLIKEEQTKRILLSYYLNYACNTYNKEALFDMYLSENYGLTYSVDVNNVGKTSILSYQITGVNPILINDENYNLKELYNIFDICINPVIVDNNFSDEIFLKAKESYLSNLYYSIDNDKQLIAKNIAISIYFKDTLRDFSPDGNIDELKKITKEELYKYYLSLKNDESVTYLAGNVKALPDTKPNIKPKIDNFFRKRNKIDFTYKEIKDLTKQCYLEIIYDLEVFSDSSLFYAAVMLNYQFGGSNNSLLFRDVREKYGLCYSISSSYYSSSGIILVSAIIDKKDEKKVLELIDKNFKELLNQINLESLKKHFKLSNKAKNEYLSRTIKDHFFDNFFPELIPSYCDNKEINKTKISDLIDCYKKMKKMLVLSYGG